MAAMEKNNKNLNVPNLRFPEFSGEWESTPISTIADIIGGGTPDTSVDDYWGGNIQWFTPSEIGKEKYAYLSDRTITEAGLKNSSAKLLPQGTVLLSTRATIGECSIATAECTTNQGFQSLVAKKNNVSSEFLYYIVAKIKREMLRRSCGSTFLEISANELKKIHANIPSKAEQEKLVSLLSLIDQRIETQKKIIEDLKKLKDAINNSMHNSIKDYQTFSFNELGNDYCGLKGKSSDDFGSGFPYISYLNVFRNDVVTDEQFDYVKVAIGEKQNIVRDGDLIFTLSSETPSEVGIGAIYQGQTTPLYLNSFCFGVHLSNQEKIYGPYLAYFVTSQYFRRTILPFAQGSTRYNLLKSDFMKHKFCFPNMASQKAIYNALHALSEKIQNEEVCLNKYTEQKQYLLTRLFI